MKKSVMLGHLWSFLYLKTDLEEESLKLLAEELLDELEELGMLPPERAMYSFDGSQFDGNANVWEKE
jgi:hypothetical protein